MCVCVCVFVCVRVCVGLCDNYGTWPGIWINLSKYVSTRSLVSVGVIPLTKTSKVFA